MMVPPRRRILAVLASGVLALAGDRHFRPRLLWNATASAPVGLYAMQRDRHPKIGELIVLTPDPALAAWMVERRYIGPGVPLVKRVAAVAGERVCRIGVHVSVDGRPAATALAHDHLGRGLPSWNGCRVLRPGQIFLLNTAPSSLDGRYFGPSRAEAVVGRASPLWLPMWR